MTGRERRELIEERATEVFAERGFHGAAVEEIARRAGISIPVLYDHFPSKQHLHRRLLERHFADLRAIWREQLSGNGAPQEQLAAALDAWFGYVESNPFAWKMLFRETTGDPEVQAMHAEVAAESRALLLPLVSERTGTGADQVDVEMAWEALRGVIQTLALWWHNNRQVPRERVVAAAMNAVWLGLERRLGGEGWETR